MSRVQIVKQIVHFGKDHLKSFVPFEYYISEIANKLFNMSPVLLLNKAIIILSIWPGERLRSPGF